jgi:hypothetical protein
MKKIIFALFILFSTMVSAQNYAIEISAADTGWKYVGTPGFSVPGAAFLCLAMNSAGTPYVAYSDAIVTGKATVMKFDSIDWTYVGEPDFSSGNDLWLSLSISPYDEPYLAFRDNDQPDSNLNVMKFNGTDWVNVGKPGFATVNPGGGVLSLATSPTGEPYVAFMDQNSMTRASVKKFDGYTWVNVDTAGFTPGMAAWIDLKFGPDGKPYLSFEDGGHFGRATVMRFNGARWEVVGFAGFTPGIVAYTSLAFDKSGNPVIAYKDEYNSGKISVKKYNGSVWETIGTPEFSDGEVNWVKLSYSPGDEPFVAFQDLANSQKMTVMRYDGSRWVNVGNNGFSNGDATSVGLVFTPEGQPFVSYPDTSGKATVMKYSHLYNPVATVQPSAITIFPNPASDYVMISQPKNSGVCQISITDIFGRTIMDEEPVANTVKVDLTGFPADIYFVKVKDGDNLYVRKLIKK